MNTQGDEQTSILPDRDPPEGVRALAMDYPLALLAGGLVAGALVGALLPKARSGRLSAGAAAIASVAGEMGLSYARKAISHTADAAASVGQTQARIADAIITSSDTASALRKSAANLMRQVITRSSQVR